MENKKPQRKTPRKPWTPAEITTLFRIVQYQNDGQYIRQLNDKGLTPIHLGKLWTEITSDFSNALGEQVDHQQVRKLYNRHKFLAKQASKAAAASGDKAYQSPYDYFVTPDVDCLQPHFLESHRGTDNEDDITQDDATSMLPSLSRRQQRTEVDLGEEGEQLEYHQVDVSPTSMYGIKAEEESESPNVGDLNHPDAFVPITPLNELMNGLHEGRKRTSSGTLKLAPDLEASEAARTYYTTMLSLQKKYMYEQTNLIRLQIKHARADEERRSNEEERAARKAELQEELIKRQLMVEELKINALKSNKSDFGSHKKLARKTPRRPWTALEISTLFKIIEESNGGQYAKQVRHNKASGMNLHQVGRVWAAITTEFSHAIGEEIDQQAVRKLYNRLKFNKKISTRNGDSLDYDSPLTLTNHGSDRLLEPLRTNFNTLTAKRQEIELEWPQITVKTPKKSNQLPILDELSEHHQIEVSPDSIVDFEEDESRHSVPVVSSQTTHLEALPGLYEHRKRLNLNFSSKLDVTLEASAAYYTNMIDIQQRFMKDQGNLFRLKINNAKLEAERVAKRAQLQEQLVRRQIMLEQLKIEALKSGHLNV